MATYKFLLFKGNKRQDGSYPVSIRVTKDRKYKLLRTGLSATEEQWNNKVGCYVPDKKLVPKFKIWNSRLSELDVQINEVFRRFEIDRVDWTLNQFEEAFFNRASRGNIHDYFNHLIVTLKETDHIGNAICYYRTLHMLELFDNKFNKRVFPEIDLKYVKSFDIFLQKRQCRGNTRKYYLKTLRAVLNKAIQEKEASETTYPFGKGGFKISLLEEETPKRYLSFESMNKLKTTIVDNITQERTRRLFLFSYFCYGISFIDAALLTKENIVYSNGGNYIVYKRNKTRETKRVKPIQIRITDEIQSHLDWFACNTKLVEDYILPIVSISGYEGEQLYNHIRSRSGRNNKNLIKLAGRLGITDLKLTSYVSRHTMAMTLQNNHVPREVISQILGHSNLATTNIYLDSFNNKVIDEAVSVL